MIRGLRKMFVTFQSWKANKSLMSPLFVERWCECPGFHGCFAVEHCLACNIARVNAITKFASITAFDGANAVLVQRMAR